MLQQQRRLIVVVSLLLLVMAFPEWEVVAIGAHLIITPYIACKERGIYSQPPGGRGVEYKSGKTKIGPLPDKGGPIKAETPEKSISNPTAEAFSSSFTAFRVSTIITGSPVLL